MKKLTLVLVWSLISCALFAQAPNDYYDTADGKSGHSLRTYLQSIIDNHTVISYSNLRYLYEYSDTKDNAGAVIVDIYSTCNPPYNTSFCAGNSCNDGYNREHSVPKSWFNRATPMYSDAFHLYPTSCKVNSTRGNMPYGETNGPKVSASWGRGHKGSCSFPGYSGTVFEPDDEYKGDLARTYFYMATRYAGKCESWGGGMFGTANEGFNTWAANLLLKWHRQDPVSDKERKRNEAIYGNRSINPSGHAQHNRNPFIDYPCLAEYIWGDKKGQSADIDALMSSYDSGYESSDKTGCHCGVVTPTIITPENNSSIAFGGVTLNSTQNETITLKAELLNYGVNVTLAGDAAFSLSTDYVQGEDAVAGIDLVLTYNPTTIGNHTATITISSAELTESTVVNVSGNCTPGIVTPTIGKLIFDAQGINQVSQQSITVKGVNLTSNVSLNITGTNASDFTLDKTSLTKAEAEAGTVVTLSYTPQYTSTHTAQLAISSPDFTEKTIDLVGQCEFHALPATGISQTQFTANWTNAGVTDYTLDVFEKTYEAGGMQTLLDETFNNTQGDFTIDNKELGGLTAVWEATAQYGMKASAYANKKNYTTESWLISPEFNLENATSATLTFDHANFKGADNSAALKLYASSNKTDWTEVTIPSWPTDRWEFTTASVSFNDYVNGSLYFAFVYTSTNSEAGTWEIKNVSLKGNIKTENKVSLDGFPKSVGNTTSYLVTGLDAANKYYYTVKPKAGSVSEEIKVGKGDDTANPNIRTENDFVYSYAAGQLEVMNIRPGSLVTIFTCSGQRIATRMNANSSESFNLPSGAYLVQIQDNQEINTTKIVL